MQNHTIYLFFLSYHPDFIFVKKFQSTVPSVSKVILQLQCLELIYPFARVAKTNLFERFVFISAGFDIFGVEDVELC